MAVKDALAEKTSRKNEAVKLTKNMSIADMIKAMEPEIKKAIQEKVSDTIKVSTQVIFETIDKSLFRPDIDLSMMYKEIVFAVDGATSIKSALAFVTCSTYPVILVITGCLVANSIDNGVISSHASGVMKHCTSNPFF